MINPDLISYIDSTGIPYRVRKGNEIALEYCPYCEHGKANGDYSHFYFNQEKQTFYCQKCEIKGNLYKFQLDRGDISPITKAKKIEYKRPKENQTFTSDTAKFYDWYLKDRGINPAILEKYKVGFKKSNSDTHIIYQYFDRKGVLFNRKYKLIEKREGIPPYYTEQGAEQGFYGLQFIDFSQPILIVCEGEDDLHALVQMGFDNVVSVPYGAGNYSPAMDGIVAEFEQIYLLFDNDPTGQQGARKFAEKAGLAKCVNVILPFKDGRECLLQGLTSKNIHDEIARGDFFKHEEIVRPEDLEDDFMDYILSTDKTVGKYTCIPEINRVIGGIRLSELSILTGHTGKGKSTFAYNFVRWAEMVGLGCMIMSFENQLNPVLEKLIEIYTGEQIHAYDGIERKTVLKKSPEWIRGEIQKLNDKELYFLNKKYMKGGYYDVERMRQVIEYAVKFHDVKLFVIDHLHYFLRLSDARNPVHVIDESIRQLKQWTLELNIHILLLVHPHMTQDNKKGESVKLGLNCVKGASSPAQESDNFWIIHRGRADEGQEPFARLEVLKNRKIGKLGNIDFKVKENLNRYEAA